MEIIDNIEKMRFDAIENGTLFKNYKDNLFIKSSSTRAFCLSDYDMYTNFSDSDRITPYIRAVIILEYKQ